MCPGRESPLRGHGEHRTLPQEALEVHVSYYPAHVHKHLEGPASGRRAASRLVVKKFLILPMATKTRRIVITMPEKMLKDVDWLAPLEDLTRDELIREAVKRFLKPHLEIRAQVLKAAAKPGKTYGPLNTADEMIAHMKGKLKKRGANVRIKDYIDTIAPTPN